MAFRLGLEGRVPRGRSLCPGNRTEGRLINADADAKIMGFDQSVEQRFGVARRDPLLLHCFQQDAQRAHGSDAFRLRHPTRKLVVAEQHASTDANGQRPELHPQRS